MDQHLSQCDAASRRLARWRPAVLRGLALALALALAGSLSAARAQQPPATQVLLPAKERQVKYALLYSFSLFTTWPPPALPAEPKFVIGILGETPFPEYLARIAETKKVQGRKIEILRFKSAEEIKPCQILYVTNSVPPEVERAVVRQLEGRQLLIVGEQPPEAGESGATIRFVIENGVVQFLLDAASAKARGLQFDARLLNLAKRPAAGAAANAAANLPPHPRNNGGP